MNTPRRSTTSTTLSLYVIICALQLSLTASFAPTSRNSARSTSTSRRFAGAADLSTAYEWLAEERSEAEHEHLSPLEWIDIMNNDTFNAESAEENQHTTNKTYRTMPLYPLGACYMPTNSTQTLHTLRNVEPQNIQMAQDLRKHYKNGNAKFCASLRAVDTGRIAAIGTVMRIVEYDEQLLWDGTTIARIVLQCVSEERVKVRRIENGAAWSRERRLLGTADYLVAQVESLDDDEEGDYNKTNDVECHENYACMLNSAYIAVRDKYTEENGDATRSYPPFAVDGLISLPTKLIDDSTDDRITQSSFWSAAEVWQCFCQTVKEANRVNLQSEVNEITIQTAMAQGGALNLPVHREDLPFEVRLRLDQMEEAAAREFMSAGVEPVLDFQYLLEMESIDERVRYLHRMIVRERCRLDAIMLLRNEFS